MERRTRQPHGFAISRTNRFRTRGLGAAAAGLAASAVPQGASASTISDIVVDESPNTSFTINTLASGEIELVSNTGMMGLDLFLEGPNGMGASSTVEFAFVPNGGMMATDFLMLLNRNDTVDGNLSFDDRVFLVDNDVENPDWAAGTTAFAGFTFDEGNGPLFGWIKVQFDALGTDFIVLTGAYQSTPNTAITIPEPGTALLLGLGLAGLAAVVRKQSPRRERTDTG